MKISPRYQDELDDIEYVRHYFCQIYDGHQIYWKANERVWVYVVSPNLEADSLEMAILSAYCRYEKVYRANYGGRYADE